MVRVRANEEESIQLADRIKILMATSEDSAKGVIESSNSLFDDYFMKSIDGKSLLEELCGTRLISWLENGGESDPEDI